MSSELIAQYRKLHESGPYGRGDQQVTETLARWIAGSGVRVESALDYGAGQSMLLDYLLPSAVEKVRYDPAIPEIAEKPQGRFDLVTCTDVMEHIPEVEITELLSEIAGYAFVALFVIYLGKASTILPNGENAHCTQRPTEWWQGRLLQHFEVVRQIPSPRKEKAFFVCT